MVNRIHQKLGTAGFIISIVALVAALGGGAYAASGGLSGKQKKEVEKIAKKYAGKPGVAGVTGPTGAKGDGGAVGAEGKQGPEGKQGAEGKQGKQGKAGTTGFTEVLPEGATETGVISLSEISPPESFAIVHSPISFSIPLEVAGPEGSAFAFTQGQVETSNFGKKTVLVGGNPILTTQGCVVGSTECFDTGCRGSAVAPTAPPGVLCVYLGLEESGNAETGEPQVVGAGSGVENGYDTAGAILNGAFLNGTPTETAFINSRGTWAVTAPE
jgi:hypothetical protein